MSFVRRIIRVSFDLANGEFEGGGNSHVVEGLRTFATIEDTGGPTQSRLELAIFGLPLSVMNQLSTVGTQYNKQYQNGIKVEAGDAESGMTLVFQGNIFTAMVDAQSMPQVCFRVVGMPGPFYANKPVEPVSVQGSADVAGLMSQFAGKMGLSFENYGVDAKVANPYLPGTTWTQMLSLARTAGINVIVARGKMTIMKPEATRPGTILVSPQTGMVGYPGFNQNNVIVASIFRPEIEYGSEIEVESDLTSACGKWKVNRLELLLESEVPNGKWFMIAEGVIIGPTVA